MGAGGMGLGAQRTAAPVGAQRTAAPVRREETDSDLPCYDFAAASSTGVYMYVGTGSTSV